MSWLDADHPAEWDEIGSLVAALWRHNPWDDAAIKAASILMHDLDPRIVLEAIGSWARDGGDHARFTPNPGEISERAREILRARRPQLPPPPGPTDEDYLRDLERTVDEAERPDYQRLRVVLHNVPGETEKERSDQRFAAIRRWLSERDGRERGQGGMRSVNEILSRALPDAERPVLRPSAEVVAQLEGYIADGREDLVPARYQHLLPQIRQQAAARREATTG